MSGIKKDNRDTTSETNQKDTRNANAMAMTFTPMTNTTHHRDEETHTTNNNNYDVTNNKLSDKDRHPSHALNPNNEGVNKLTTHTDHHAMTSNLNTATNYSNNQHATTGNLNATTNPNDRTLPYNPTNSASNNNFSGDTRPQQTGHVNLIPFNQNLPQSQHPTDTPYGNPLSGNNHSNTAYSPNLNTRTDNSNLHANTLPHNQPFQSVLHTGFHNNEHDLTNQQVNHTNTNTYTTTSNTNSLHQNLANTNIQHQNFPNTNIQQQGLPNTNIQQQGLINTYNQQGGVQNNQRPNWYGQVPQNYVPTAYPLSKVGLKRANTVFQQYNQDKSGYMTLDQLETMVNGVLASEGLGPVRRDDLNYLVNKYDFDANKRISSREFKRMMKELAGKKKFDRSTISVFNYKTNEGPYPGQTGYVDPYAHAGPGSHYAATYLPPNYLPRAYPLSENGIKYSKTVFNHHKINTNGFVDINELEMAIRQVYNVDHQVPPTIQDIAYLLNKHDYNTARPMSAKEFRRLLKELGGYKEYNKGTMGFFKKIFPL